MEELLEECFDDCFSDERMSSNSSCVKLNKIANLFLFTLTHTHTASIHFPRSNFTPFQTKRDNRLHYSELYSCSLSLSPHIQHTIHSNSSNLFCIITNQLLLLFHVHESKWTRRLRIAESREIYSTVALQKP